jgi:hypothetical protein
METYMVMLEMGGCDVEMDMIAPRNWRVGYGPYTAGGKG